MGEHRAMGEGLRVHLFGEPHIEYNGSTHAFAAPPKTLPLLAFLLLHREAPQAREAIATALWPESEHTEALANLRRHLHYLNKALPPAAPDFPWVLSMQRSVSWNAAAPYWLDVEAFETESQDRRYRAHAVRLYSGDLYERCADEWIFFKRERLRSQQMSNLASLVAEARERKAYLQALQYAQLMLALDPWREDALRSVLEIRGLLGDTAGALAEYERFAQRLQEELGVAPGADTLQLYTRLKKSGASAQRDTRIADAPTVAGRRNELAILSEAWHRASQGRVRMVAIGGDAGIGKTTLLEALAAVAHAEGATVLRGGSAPNSPYQAFIDIFRELGASALHDLAAKQPSTSDGDDRLKFFDSVAQVFERAAGQRPTLVLLEDLHLAGAASLDLLRYLVTRLENAPILFAATYREYDVDRTHPLRAMRRQLARSGHLAHLAVTPLDRDSARELLRSRSARQIPDETMERIYEAADGNPLFMIEALHQLAQGSAERIPASLATIVRERLEKLDSTSRAVAENAAAAGRLCTVELIAQVTGVSEGQALRAFDELLERHIVRESLSGDTGEFAFVHDSVRQSVYDTIPAGALRKKHARLGLALQKLHAQEIDEMAGVLARHFEIGGLTTEAAEFYVKAAEASLRLYALEEAHYCASKARELSADASVQSRALLALDSIAEARGALSERAQVLCALQEFELTLPPQMQTELLFRRVAVLTATSDASARRELAALRKAVARNGQLRARYLLLAGDFLHQNGKHRRALLLLREAYRLFQERGELQQALSSFDAWLQVAIACGGLRPEVMDEVLPMRDASDPRTAALLASARAAALFNYDSERAFGYAEQMLAAARQAEDRWLEAVALRKLGSNASQMNRISLAHSYLQRSAELMLASGRPFDIANVRIHQMKNFIRATYSQGVHELFDQTLAAARACGSIDFQVRAEVCLLDAQEMEGDHSAWYDGLQRALANVERHGLGGAKPGILRGLALYKMAHENPQAGLQTLLQALHAAQPWGMNFSNYAVELALAYLCTGDEVSARGYVAQIRASMKELATMNFWPHAFLWGAANALHFLGEEQDAQRFADAACERYSEILAEIDEGPMRRAFLNYPFHRQIAEYPRTGNWARDPLHAFLLNWDVGDVRPDNAPLRTASNDYEQAKAGA